MSGTDLAEKNFRQAELDLNGSEIVEGGDDCLIIHPCTDIDLFQPDTAGEWRFDATLGQLLLRTIDPRLGRSKGRFQLVHRRLRYTFLRDQRLCAIQRKLRLAPFGLGFCDVGALGDVVQLQQRAALLDLAARCETDRQYSPRSRRRDVDRLPRPCRTDGFDLPRKHLHLGRGDVDERRRSLPAGRGRRLTNIGGTTSIPIAATYQHEKDQDTKPDLLDQ